ncbi:MAG TPA: GAF domain-containing protein [Terriglobales bacterium]|jgi:sigma-B regulation protein RsbU (phosphoserine phosphatase)|nr:GAF domain-containing protein [Terriglobales bacterium]
METFLVEVAEVVNTTLDLDTLLTRTAELTRRVIDYEVFSILLLNEKTQEMRMRFAIGHSQETKERTRIKVGEGVTGLAAQRREAVLVDDISKESRYIGVVKGQRSELAVPLIVKNRVVGVIDVEAREAGYFNEEHRRLLTLIASRIAAGIENARLYTRVSRQAQTLTVLNEISQELTSILNLDELLRRIAELLTRLIDYQMFSILLLDQTQTKLEHRFSVRYKENVPLKHDIPIGTGLVGYAAREKTAVLVSDVQKDERYIQLNPETRSELCVPLIYKGSVIGVLDLEHTRRGYFTDDHRKTISTLAAQVAIAIENARLYQQLAKEEQRIEQDLATARELQFGLLPSSCPVLKGVEFAARYVPAHAVGGDMYDFITYMGGRTGIATADVSGKGVRAALYAALVSGLLRSSAADEPDAAEMLTLLNSALIERRIEAQFVAMLYAIWDENDRTLQVANSGMPRPILCKKGVVEIVQATGLPLGFFEDAEYEEFLLPLAPGDVCVLLSDGIVDATNYAGETMGRPRVEKLVGENWERSAEDILEIIFQVVNQHADGVATFDDQTVLVIKAKEAAHSKKKTKAAKEA